MPEITQEELDLFEQYKTLGTFEELVTKDTASSIEKAAAVTGFKKTVLTRLLKTLPSDHNLLLSEDSAFIQTPDGEIELSKFAEDEWAEFMPSLKEQAKQQVAGIRQSSEPRDTSKKSASKKLADKYIQQTYGWALKTDSVN